MFLNCRQMFRRAVALVLREAVAGILRVTIAASCRSPRDLGQHARGGDGITCALSPLTTAVKRCGTRSDFDRPAVHQRVRRWERTSLRQRPVHRAPVRRLQDIDLVNDCRRDLTEFPQYVPQRRNSVMNSNMASRR